jgi:hypothetical protein
MATITVFPQAAGPTGKVTKYEQKSAPVSVTSDKPEHTDADMMYAWSIGITSVARTLTQMPRHEECPPEVYIG